MTDPAQPAGDAAPRNDPPTNLGTPEPGGPAVRSAAPSQPAATTLPGAAPVTPGALPLASVIAKPKSSGGRGTSLLLVLASAIAIGGIAFAAGRLTAPAAATAGRFGDGQFPGRGQGLPGNGQGFPGQGAGFAGISLAGTVDAVSADSITVKLESGTSITIPLDAKTTYHAAAAATAGDVTVGSEVRVTPGARAANPGASFDPDASPGPGGGISFGAASDVTIVEP
jgi:hypothetical protein